MGIFENLKRVVGAISFGLIFILAYGFLFIKAGSLFPNNIEGFRLYLQISAIFFTFLVGTASVVSSKETTPLFQISFLSGFGKFILSALISFVSFYLLFFMVKGSAIPTITTALAGISIPILLLYAFVVSFPEELIFRGRIADELAYKLKRFNPRWRTFVIYLLPTLAFAVYHWSLGRSLFTLIIYIPLGILFTYLKRRFSPTTNFANAGAHFAWDIFIFAFFP